jgi:hypothetical protein
LIEANIPELARLESLQAGKALNFAKLEMMAPVETFRCTSPQFPTYERLRWLDR